jgi:Flp pilus assembly pilin Flp
MSQEKGYMAEGRRPTARLVAWFQEAKAALRGEGGQTLLEYALVIGFIAIAAVAAMVALAPALGHAFEAVTGVIDEYMPL